MDNSEVMELARDVHKQNIEAGWWTDLKTGGSTIATRNRPEMLMLIVSELSEASEGVRLGHRTHMDDKLEHRPMFEVEIADAAIRLFDLIGAETSEYTPAPAFDELRATCDMEMSIGTHPDRKLMFVVNIISKAMEAYRKKRLNEYVGRLFEAQVALFVVATRHEIDLLPIIDEKREYNRNRADHKIENRKAAGGKSF